MLYETRILLELERRNPPMTDLAVARRMMVDCQVRPSDVTDLRIIAAMLELPRERFVAQPELAYLDADAPVSAVGAGAARRLIKPMVLAKMVQAADIGPDDRVLDVGCATGYSAALLARLAGRVVALEEDPALVRLAAGNLAGCTNVTVETGALRQGWQAHAPYDVILLDGATEIVPDALCRQLGEGGRLVAIMRRAVVGQAMLYRAAGGEISGWPVFDACAPLLPGFAATPEFSF
jgi:protein-L-isoaspartate(D-aspartate) O-methyltransferase